MSEKQTPYSASTDQDSELNSTVISLSYQDSQNPTRSIIVSLAPDLGSNMFRFRVGDYDLIYSEPALLKRKDFTGNFVLWPLPNRVRDKQYTYQGQTYSLKDVKRPQGNDVLIHGLVFDRAWHYDPPVLGPDSASVTTYVDIIPTSPLYAAYPFNSRLSLTYTLSKNSLTTTYHVRNTGDKDLPFGFALHPYFSLLSGKHDTSVSLPADAVMEADVELLPTGRIFDLNTLMYAMYDLRQPMPVGSLKLDHVYTNLHKNEPAIIEYKQQAMQLHISSSDDFTHIVIYTPAEYPYFCLEHQTCATDAVNLHNQDPERRIMAHLLELHPGETHTGSLHYALHFI